MPYHVQKLTQEGVAQVVDHLLCKHEALLQTPVPPKINSKWIKDLSVRTKTINSQKK
jgi:hypothetical protein